MDPPDEEDFFDPTLVMNWDEECDDAGVGDGGGGRSSHSFSSANDDDAGAALSTLHGPTDDAIIASSSTGIVNAMATVGTTAASSDASHPSSLATDAMMTMIASYFPNTVVDGVAPRYTSIGGIGPNHPLAMTSMASCSPLDPIAAAMGGGYRPPSSLPSSAPQHQNHHTVLPPLFELMRHAGTNSNGSGEALLEHQQRQQLQHHSSSSNNNNSALGGSSSWYPLSSSTTSYLPRLSVPTAHESGGIGPTNSIIFNNINANNVGGVDKSFFNAVMNGNLGGCGGSRAANATLDGTANIECGHSASATAVNAAQVELAGHLHQLTSNFQASHNSGNGNGNNNNNAVNSTILMTMPMQAMGQQPMSHPPQHQHHYGITVNGFHPQVNAQANNVLPLMGGGCGVTSHRGGFGENQNIQQPRQQQGAVQQSRSDACGVTGTTATNVHGVSDRASVSSGGINAAIPHHQPIPPKDATTGHGRLSASAIAIAADANDNIRISENADMPMMMGLMHARNSRERNEREQVRAKKITQLITDLRSEMHSGGWRVEMKSKYQVLSQCQDYVDYLKRHHKTKEADIEQTKKLFEEQQRQRKAVAVMKAQSSDDSESIASSVTDSTALITGRRSAALNVNMDDDENSSSRAPSSVDVDGLQNNDGTKQQMKRKRANLHVDPHNPLVPAQEQSSNKKPHSSPSSTRDSLAKGQVSGVGEVVGEDQQSYAEMSSISEDDDENNIGNHSCTPGGRRICFDKANSNMSDITSSNQGEEGGQGENSSSSVSSTAAVVRGLGSSQLKRHGRRHRSDRIDRNLPAMSGECESNNVNSVKEMNVCSTTTASTSHHKKKRRSFHYDYREVFLKSNVPQFIATLSGRIVVWNDFFLLATNLSERDAKRLTIFSIVQSSQLSNLYKMVARALADKSVASDSATSAKDGSNTAVVCATPSADGEEWQAITLKCIPFSSNCKAIDSTHKRRGTKTTTSNATQRPIPLYINVTMMDDENRDQRCFHCVLTDCPGSNGKLGCVTPKLFSTLFVPSGTKKTVVA